MGRELHLLCAGAAQGLVKALAPAFEAATGSAVTGRFGAVGAMKEALLAGEPCDLMIVTDAMVDALVADGRLQAEGCTLLGRVATGVAVKAGQPVPDVATAEALRAALASADAVYFPDPERATAGIHFAKVMQSLGLADELRPRWRTFPNGATSMRELAAATSATPIGCTQVSEILYTPGVQLAGDLPAPFQLTTPYTAAPSATPLDPALARAFLALLAGPESAVLRAAGGFLP